MTSVAPYKSQFDWLEKVEKQLQAVVKEAAEYAEDYEVSPAPSTHKAAKKLISDLFYLKFPQPVEIYAGNNGEIVFVWRHTSRKLEAWLLPSGEINIYFKSPREKQHAQGCFRLKSLLKQLVA